MKQAESFEELYQQVKHRKVPFLLVFALILLVSYGFLYYIDFIPEPVEEETATESSIRESAFTAVNDSNSDIETVEIVNEPVTPAVVEPAADVLPRKVFIDALDKEITVLNPESRIIADLDEALLSGVVRHPDSADYSQDGNVFILGHSSYLPTVFNRNFQAFNGIQDLVWGDTIRVQTNDNEYLYRVQEVYEAKASELFVPNTPGESRLTLATCDSFGSKDDRYIVEAVLIKTTAL